MSVREGRWADPVQRLEVSELADRDAVNLNVAGRRLSGAVQGFGPLWQKTYWTRLSGADISPSDVIHVWKRDYPDFWPDNSYLHRAVARLEPGDVAVINASQSGLHLSTGVFVMYVDDESFAFALPEGHMFSGWITFSAHRDGETMGCHPPYGWVLEGGVAGWKPTLRDVRAGSAGRGGLKT